MFRNGLVPKLVSYIAVVMLVFSSDVFIINGLTTSVISVEFISTKVIALVLLSIEVKSMDESWIKVKGYSFIDKIKAIIVKLKDVKKEL
jgi:sensor histidine kinase YesM